MWEERPSHPLTLGGGMVRAQLDVNGVAMAIMGPITGVELIPSHLRLYIRGLLPPL